MSIKKLIASFAVVAAAVTAGFIVSGIARADGHATPAKPDPHASIVSHDARDNPKNVRDYWTPERMNQASPAPMPSTR